MKQILIFNMHASLFGVQKTSISLSIIIYKTLKLL